MSIGNNILELRAEMPPGVELVAVSKFHPASAIMEAYKAGQRLFGESRVQEFLAKYDELPHDIRWHFIGHLQTNKAKSIIGKTALIESVDSERLLKLIDNESYKTGVVSEVLLQVHVAAEEAKFGFFPDELRDFFAGKEHLNLKATRIRGLMGMATNTHDENRIRADFSLLHSIFTEIKEKLSHEKEKNSLCGATSFDKLSMGMSGDWQLAIAEGSTIVRIGSAIFGARY